MARRNKREPFNPFASGVTSKTQKKQQKTRPKQISKTPTISRQDQIEAMRKKIREQQKISQTSINKKSVDLNLETKTLEKIEEQNSVEIKEAEVKEVEVKEVDNKKLEVKGEINLISKKENKESLPLEYKKESKEKDLGKIDLSVNSSKLEDLKRRSDALAAKTGVNLPVSDAVENSLFLPKKVKNIDVVKKPKIPTKTVKKTKKGGGRQPKQQKLNRRKQLEFRFDARAILDNSSVAEEHRSNVFGQIWAKGERMGIQSAIEYISQKEEEGIFI